VFPVRYRTWIARHAEAFSSAEWSDECGSGRRSPGGERLVMTLHKPHAGDGYTYLTRQVAAGDEGRSPGQELTDYYTASGNPPGRWLGSGAADLQVNGRVREDQMRSLFGRGLHPDAEEIVALETAAGTSPEAAERAVKLGRAFPATSRCHFARNGWLLACPIGSGSRDVRRRRWCAPRSKHRRPGRIGVRSPATTWSSPR
jgi:hypothetical protein